MYAIKCHKNPHMWIENPESLNKLTLSDRELKNVTCSQETDHLAMIGYHFCMHGQAFYKAILYWNSQHRKVIEEEEKQLKSITNCI